LATGILERLDKTGLVAQGHAESLARFFCGDAAVNELLRLLPPPLNR